MGGGGLLRHRGKNHSRSGCCASRDLTTRQGPCYRNRMPDVRSYECDGPECETIGRAVKSHTYRPARPDRWIEMDLTQTDSTRSIKATFCSVTCYQQFAMETSWDPDVGFALYGRPLEPEPVDHGPTPARGPHTHQIRYAFERKRVRCRKSCCAWRWQYRENLILATRQWPANATTDLRRNLVVLDVLAEL